MAQTLPFPWFLLLLDAVGTVLVGVGLAEWLGGIELVPESLRVEYLIPLLLGVGLVLMVPALALMVGKISKAGR